MDKYKTAYKKNYVNKIHEVAQKDPKIINHGAKHGVAQDLDSRRYELDGSRLVEIPKESDESVLDVMNDTLIVPKKRLIEKVVNKDIKKYKPDIWVLKWVDYSSKYGFAYLLSNDTLGINFND